MSQFDPQAFLDTEFDAPNEKRPPLPVDSGGDGNGLYTAVIGDIEAKSGDKNGKPWLQMLVPLTVEVPQPLRDALKLPPVVKLIDRVFIDLTEQGTIDNAPGRNNRQRMYREAVGMNKPGVPFSWRKMPGRVVKVKVNHELYEGNIQERVAQVFGG